MGAMLTCCVADALCCAGAGAVKCCCCAIPCKASTSTRLLYTLGFVCSIALAWVLSHWGHVLASSSPRAITLECNDDCFDYLAVYRVSLASVIYHGALCLLTIGVGTSKGPRGVIHNGIWPIKFLAWFGILVGMFFIPAEKLLNYWIAAVVFSAMFILLQAYILVDFGWNWSASWVGKWEESKAAIWKILLIFVTVSNYLLVIGGTIALYIFFTRNDGCGINIFYITLNLALCIIVTIMSLLPKIQDANPRSGIFQSGILSVYTTYLVASAISSEPNEPNGFACSPQPPGTGEDSLSKAMVYVGIGITFLALGYSALSAGSVQLWTDIEAGGTPDPDDESEAITYSYAFFHFVFVMAAMYMAAVITNWSGLSKVTGMDGTGGTGSQVDYAIDKGFASVWVKVATGWACIALYAWTLIAPILFPGRDFGV
ncbi:serine incorporator/TMS membrane protein [Powellomyces hirtus]|nr:serine incorporator/TMS membrane protein [Powellomyces hirtus]